MSRFNEPVIANGYIESGNGGGVKYPNVNGCIANGAGTGITEIAFNPPNDGYADDRYLITITFGFGTQFPLGLSYGVSSLGTVTYGRGFNVKIIRNDTGAAIDMPFSFSIKLRSLGY